MSDTKPCPSCGGPTRMVSKSDDQGWRECLPSLLWCSRYEGPAEDCSGERRKGDRRLAAQDEAPKSHHRVCISEEHDPENGKMHGCCVICAEPWPCSTERKDEAPGLALAEAVMTHYSASLDYRPPYVALAHTLLTGADAPEGGEDG